MLSASENLATQSIVSVAVPVPLRQSFDFILPTELHADLPENPLGVRVKVPFGPRKLIGVITGYKEHSDYPLNKLKKVLEVLDDNGLFEPQLWDTLAWLSRYYLAPIGEVIELALPVLLRQGNETMPRATKTWRLSDHGRSSSLDELHRAPLQLAIIRRFMRNSSLSNQDFKESSSGWRAAIASLLEKGWIEELQAPPQLPASAVEPTTAPVLNQEQAVAAQGLLAAIKAQKFSSTLLHGVTGSGKTEVYFAAIEAVVTQGEQVLLLVPEIGLTPQLVERVMARFECGVVLMHSALNDTERHLAWWHAKQGNAKIVIGTRSAVFSSFQNLGLIIVDEEHDGSFKQQDSVRYQARDVAIYRAKQHQIPIVLGSATPSLESYWNAKQARYQLLRLEHRATDAALPSIELLDLNRQPSVDGLSPAMLSAIAETLQQGKQAMLFLNRRGYAPVLYCKDCRATANCHRCDSNLTLHQRINRMRCHHCGYEGTVIRQCASCSSQNMVEVGEGTQRVEEALAMRFPNARLLRIDRDSTRRKGELETLLEQVRAGEVDIVLGTQLITKGHDFPEMAMVGVLEADQGLYSTDFRASEALFQQIVQVSGRAGRREQLGSVFIQTRFPEHPFFTWVLQHDFNGFAEELLEQRRVANYPPFGNFALLRAESTHQAKALQFLRRAKSDMQATDGVRVMDAIPAPMERRAGKYRAQLLIVAQQRSMLNAMLVQWLNLLVADPVLKRRSQSVRWSLDIDPLDHY